MKTVITKIAFFALICAYATTAVAQTNTEGFKYFERLNSEMKRVNEKQMVNSNAQVHSKDVKAQRTAQLQVVGQINIAISNLKTLKDFNKSTLRQAHLKMYDALLKTYNGEYEKLFALAKTAEESVETMEVYLKLQEDANNKVNNLGDSVRMLNRAFAAENQINLIDGETEAAKKFEEAMSLVGTYRRKLFIEHFKISKRFAPMVDDINKNKGKKMASFIAPMQKTCEEVLLALPKIGEYDGDGKMLKAVREEAEFYLNECKQNLPGIAKLMAKPQLDSKEEVDAYNKWNRNFVEKSNKLSQKYSEEEDRLWDKHVPVYKGAKK
jgi:hypothetical protein